VDGLFYMVGLRNLRIPPTEVGGWFQIQPVRPKEGPMKLNSLLNALGRFVSEAGSEQSTHCRGWDFDHVTGLKLRCE